jgi:ceramide glucosyltransferase
MYPKQSVIGFWEHQVRWARTVRLCRPLSYFGLLFTQGLPWVVLAAFIAPAKWMASLYLLAYIVLRFLMAWTVGIWGVGDELLRDKIWLIPLRDAIHFIIWLASFGSNRVRWGNADYRIQQGRMVPIARQETVAAKPAETRPRS